MSNNPAHISAGMCLLRVRGSHRLGTGKERVAQALSRSIARGSGPELGIFFGILICQVRHLPAALTSRCLPVTPPGLACSEEV